MRKRIGEDGNRTAVVALRSPHFRFKPSELNVIYPVRPYWVISPRAIQEQVMRLGEGFVGLALLPLLCQRVCAPCQK